MRSTPTCSPRPGSSRRVAERLFAVCLAGLLAGVAAAQDARDDEIFGGAESAAPASSPPDARDDAIFGGGERSSPAPAASSALLDALQIGGRLEIRASTGRLEEQKLPQAGFQQLKQADVYLDARPNKDVRAFLRGRLTEQSPAVGEPGVRQDIDELWFKWDYADAVYFTYGKQHLKWGSSRFWNPTDFTALEARDPFALFDRRLGQELLKVHVPNERRGFNYYAVLQLDAARNDDLGAALRGEFALFGSAEAAFTYQTRRGRPQRFGADISSALGPLDVNVETAVSRRHDRDFFSGALDPAAEQLPVASKRDDRWFTQVSAGLRSTIKYSDEDNVTFGAEYFHNELGYEDRVLSMYALALGQSQPLYAGRRYAAVYASLPTPGSWNKTSFYLNGMRNLSDGTAVVRLTETWELHREATIEVFVSQCYGDYGELCFRVTDEIRQLGQSPALPPDRQQLIQAMPTRRTALTAGVGFSMTL